MIILPLIIVILICFYLTIDGGTLSIILYYIFINPLFSLAGWFLPGGCSRKMDQRVCKFPFGERLASSPTKIMQYNTYPHTKFQHDIPFDFKE